jgi:citrate lyase beta subunit
MAERESSNEPALRALLQRVAAANAAVAKHHPGESERRQPVHTVYGGAQLFKHDTARKLGEQARRAFDEYAPDPESFAQAIDLDVSPEHHRLVHQRVADKLGREAVEDFRIDFEDGYGNRSDEEEDGHARAAARELAKGMQERTLPPFVGIRVKTFSDDRLCARAIRTSEIVLSTLLEATSGALPDNFVICLPKIRHREHVAAFAELLELFEKRFGLAAGTLKFELMIENTLTIFDERGSLQLPLLLDAARGRCVAAHFGTYDYTASLGITAAHQRMRHPACDHAKHAMQVAFAGTGVWLSDGSTAILPVPVHGASGGRSLTAVQRAENRAGVHAAWRLHADDVRHSLAGGFYQGWDLHPAQLVSRYAAVFEFFLAGLTPASERLQNFVAKAAQATLVGDVFDDAATGQGLLNYFLRGVQSGAISEARAVELSGLTVDEIRGRSFVAILKARGKV